MDWVLELVSYLDCQKVNYFLLGVKVAWLCSSAVFPLHFS